MTFDEAIAGPDDTVAAATNAVTAGAFFQSMPTAGDGANLSSDHLYDGAVGLTPQGQLLTVFADASGDAQFRVHDGGDPNDAATWGAPVDIGERQRGGLGAGGRGARHAGLAVWVTDGQVRAAQVGADQPVFGRTVVVRPVSGTVRVKVPGAKSFVGLAAAGSVPLGSSVDVEQGRLALSAAPSTKGRPRTVQLYQGRFKVTQFALDEALAACRASASAGRGPKTRRLWGDGSGRFRTSGRYSAATVRGTHWLVQDSCAGTLTRVAKGAVAVRDNVRHRTILVRAGKRYLAKPRR